MIGDECISEIRKAIASANINFLIGSGASRPFLDVLNDIESKLDQAERDKDEDAEAEIKSEYFKKCIEGNLELFQKNMAQNAKDVLTNYEEFYKAINYILLRREDSLLTKQVNVFTTNIDVFSEKAFENTLLEFNDGFSGRFELVYDNGNYNKSYFKKSLHYENTSEIPIFNLLKLHGSVSWKREDGKILLDQELSLLKKINASDQSSFIDNFNSLQLINPTKKKLQDTVLNEYYYGLLRIYANALEKENSILFVVGFSFADEHIHKLTMQVSNSNPTLTIYIFCHTSSSSHIYESMVSEAKNKNIKLIKPQEGELTLQSITESILVKLTPKDSFGGDAGEEHE